MLHDLLCIQQTNSEFFVIQWINLKVLTQRPFEPAQVFCFVLFFLYKQQQKNTFLHASFALHVDSGWLYFLKFFPFFFFFIKMSPSGTARIWTLLAALALLSCCSIGWCEASRTSSSTSAGSKQEQGPSSLERVKRGWVWNQFFVVEEYTGTEPLYVGKVRYLTFLMKHFFRKSLCLSIDGLNKQKKQSHNSNQIKCRCPKPVE